MVWRSVQSRRRGSDAMLPFPRGGVRKRIRYSLCGRTAMEQILDMQGNGGSFDQFLERNGSGASSRNGIAKSAELFIVAFVRFTALPQNFILAGPDDALEVIDDVGFTV